MFPRNELSILAFNLQQFQEITEIIITIINHNLLKVYLISKYSEYPTSPAGR